MSFSTKDIVIGLMVGLVIGSSLGYVIAPKGVDTTELEQHISQLEEQVDNLQNRINDKDTQLITSLQ